MPPNLIPHPYVPRNVSRAYEGAQGGEESSRLRCVVPEKIGVKEKTLAPPGDETGSGRGQMTSWVGRARGGLQPVSIRCRWGVGGRRYSTESKSRPAPVMEYGKKVHGKILLYTHTRRAKILLRSRSTKLLHTQRIRSRFDVGGRVGEGQFWRPRTPMARSRAVKNCRTLTFTLLASQLDVTEPEVAYRGRP